MIYFIVTTSLYNDCNIRKQQYTNGINKLKEVVQYLNIENYKIIIVENNGIRNTFLNDFDCSVCYTNNNFLSINNSGHKELLDILECIRKYCINNDDFIVKITGRYILENNSEFMRLVKNLKYTQYECIVKFGCFIKPLSFKTNDCITGLIGMKCKYIKLISFPFETRDYCEPIEWKWAEATSLIEEKNICAVKNELGINVCPGTNDYYLV